MDHQPDPLQPGALYIVATPIGNLRDISLRALDVLRQVDLVAAEDTRITLRLFDRHGIQTRLMSVHEHNEREAAARIIERLQQGASIACVTDAGTPGISDPGARLADAVQQAGFKVVPVPGACAAIAALSAAGLVAPHFVFYGFLPATAAARRRELEPLAGQPWPIIFYEAPHRVGATIADLLAAFGPQRTLLIAREITKQFEQIVRLPLCEAATFLAADANHQRGEFVLIVDAPILTKDENLALEAERVLGLLLAQLPLKQAVSLAADITGERRNDLYTRALAMKDA